MSGKGRRASLPECGHARPEYLVTDQRGGVVVRHYDHEGKVLEFDFTKLPVAGPMRSSLAALFSARCTPDRWSVHRTSKAAWIYLRLFAEFLAGMDRPPQDLDEITPALVQRWKASQRGVQGAALVVSLLRGDARLQSGPVADELARHPRRPRSTVQSYSQAEFDEIARAARRGFRAALQRINDNAMHLQQWRDGVFAEGSEDWVLGEGLDYLTCTGDLPRYASGRFVVKRYLRAFGGSHMNAWQSLFLTKLEAVALGVLLMADFGWNQAVIDSLEVPMASPDQGDDGHPTYRVPLEKRRRGPRHHHETRNVTDHGAGSSGRLITQALAATRFARAIVEGATPGTNRLIVWRPMAAAPPTGRERQSPGGLFGLGIPDGAGQDWARAEGLGGSPFRRGRRTVIALDRREPAQHSRDTHDRYYVLPDQRVQAEAAEVFAAGARAAADHAREVVLVARLRDRPAPGDVETATADCASYHDSPYPSPRGGCGASFLMCLACPNARIHPGHHPRLAHLHEALGSLRSILTPAAWIADWRDAHDRLEDLRQRVGAGPWVQALSAVTDADRELIGHLVNGSLG